MPTEMRSSHQAAVGVDEVAKNAFFNQLGALGASHIVSEDKSQEKRRKVDAARGAGKGLLRKS